MRGWHMPTQEENSISQVASLVTYWKFLSIVLTGFKDIASLNGAPTKNAPISRSDLLIKLSYESEKWTLS